MSCTSLLALLVLVTSGCATSSGASRLAPLESPASLESRAAAVPAEPSAPRRGEQEEPRFTVAPYLWLASMAGDLTARGVESEVDEGFGDILDVTDFGLMVHTEARFGRWGIYFDPVYLALSTEGEVGEIEVDVEADLTIAEAGALYRVDDRTSDAGRRTYVDLLGGLRYTGLDAELEADGGPLGEPRDADQDWVDLVLGARIVHEFSERWSGSLRADVGGFDLSSSSDFAWNVQALVGRAMGEGGTLFAGYKVLDIDYDDGSGSDEFGWDIQNGGPVLGFQFTF